MEATAGSNANFVVGDASETLHSNASVSGPADAGVETATIGGGGDVARLLFTAQSEMAELKANVNYFFILICSILIFIMQTGFAFLEAGMIRAKNTVNILLKNALDTYISVIVYWAIGFSLAKGRGNSFAGHSWWFGAFPEELLAKWFHEFCFAATAATIVSGALAERCGFYAYLVYSTLITGIVYPLVSRWAWYTNTEGGGQGGWLADGRSVISGVQFQDFSGSGVVHLVAGTAALSGAIFIGPRIGRFDEHGNVVEIEGHSAPLSALGAFILMFGFFAFNGGSVATITDARNGIVMSRAIVNTVVSAAAAAMSALFLRKFVAAHGGRRCCATWKAAPWKLETLVNGTLCGMVAVCAGCESMEMWGAFCTGLVSGALFLLLQWIVTHRAKVDDPCDVVAVHFGSGLWGIIAAPIFDSRRGILTVGDRRSVAQLAVNLAGAAAIIAWTFASCSAIFGALRCAGLLRCSRDEELKGMDAAEHGAVAYPAAAYRDGWGTGLGSHCASAEAKGHLSDDGDSPSDCGGGDNDDDDESVTSMTSLNDAECGSRRAVSKASSGTWTPGERMNKNITLLAQKPAQRKP